MPLGPKLRTVIRAACQFMAHVLSRAPSAVLCCWNKDLPLLAPRSFPPSISQQVTPSSSRVSKWEPSLLVLLCNVFHLHPSLSFPLASDMTVHMLFRPPHMHTFGLIYLRYPYSFLSPFFFFLISNSSENLCLLHKTTSLESQVALW